MSLAVHERHAAAGPAGNDRRQRLVVAAAAAATLAVIAAPGGLALVTGRVPGEQELTVAAERVLDEVPAAYEAGGAVVVPADGDPHVVWLRPVAEDLLHGDVVDLGVNGLTGFGQLATRGESPAWRYSVEPSDNVFSGVGPVSFACIPSWTAVTGEQCTGSVLMQHEGRHYVVHEAFDVPGETESVARFNALGPAGVTGVWVGTVPQGTASVSVRASDGHAVVTRTSAPGAVGGKTIWWAQSSSSLTSVVFRDADGRAVERFSLGG